MEYWSEGQAGEIMTQELRGPFPWGVLLITDSLTKEDIPNWRGPGEQVTSAASTHVLRVLHGDEGEVSVHVHDNESDARGACQFSGEIDLPSGILRVSDALGTLSTEISASPGRHKIEIYTDASVEASDVHIVLEP